MSNKGKNSYLKGKGVPNIKEDLAPYIELRPSSSIPQSVINELYLISFIPEEQISPFGSYVYRVQKYPGDIDGRQVFEECCTVEDVVKKFMKELKRVVKDVISKKHHYYSEIKAGFDPAYNIPFGTVTNGIWSMDDQFTDNIYDLYDIGKLNDEEYRIISELLESEESNTVYTYDIIYNLIRERKIFRWTAEEILKGYLIRNGEKFKLSTALAQKSAVKIDEICILDGKFVEVTNFVMLAYRDEDDELVPINLDYNLNDREDMHKHMLLGLKDEIEKLYYSDLFYSPFKMIKRMYALCRHNYSYFREKDEFSKMVLEKIIPFISGNISLLYQMRSEIESIILVTEKIGGNPKKSISNSLGSIKQKLANVLEITDEELEYLNKLIDKAAKSNIVEDRNTYLHKISKIFKNIISSESIRYLDSVGLNPPLPGCLPEHHKYNRSIVRPVDE